MKVSECKLHGCYIIEHDVYEDKRGTFIEAFNQKLFQQKIDQNINFVQDNLSVSKRGVLRGLHFQKHPFEQSKLIQVVRGEALDVIVDLRKYSPTFGEHFKIKIAHKERKSIFIPKGMAHGFLCLSKELIFTYKCDEFYNPKSESGIIYNDPDLRIDWGFPKEELIISDKDKKLQTFQNFLL